MLRSIQDWMKDLRPYLDNDAKDLVGNKALGSLAGYKRNNKKQVDDAGQLYMIMEAWHRLRQGDLKVVAPPETLGDRILKRANDGYRTRLTTGPQDYPPFAVTPWDDRQRWSKYIKAIADEIEAEDKAK